MSQYGAYGAALAGLNYRQILAFYYPGTRLTTVPSSTTLRVLISGGYAWTCIQNKAGLSIAGSKATLPGTSVAKSLRIIPDGSYLRIRPFAGANCDGSRLTSYDVPVQATSVYLASKDGFVRLQLPGGYWTEYRGRLGTVRQGSGELTINKVGLDQYAQGVAPRESPASWGVTALSAQAVAARTYAEYEREHAPRTAKYDICDTPSCQVYGGKAHHGSRGDWSDYPDAVKNDRGVIVTYKGTTAFTQYSASNGGRTADGGQPYLIAKADPYDNAATGDPYLNVSRLVPVSSLAKRLGLKTVTAIDITGRDGGGSGYVTSAVVYGTNPSGATVSEARTGYALQRAFGLYSPYFTIQSAPPSNLTSYVRKVYQVLLGTSPTSKQLLNGSLRLAKGTPARTYTAGLSNSSAAIEEQVRRVFAGVGRKAPSKAVLKSRPATIRRIGYLRFEVNQFSTASYFRKVGSYDRKWVRSLYRSDLVCGREASATTIRRFTRQLKHGASRQTVARRILTSKAVQHCVVRSEARAVLGRPLHGAAELARWSKTLRRTAYTPTKLEAIALALGSVRKRYGLKR